MSDHHVEKLLLYFLALSLLLHTGITVFLLTRPQATPPTPPPAYMVELSDLPELRPAPPSPPAKRQSLKRQRVPREKAPRGVDLRDRPAVQPLPSQRSAPPAPAKDPTTASSSPTERGVAIGERPKQVPEQSDSIFRPRQPAPAGAAKLFPSAERLAKLEEGYRKKYSEEVREGDAKFLNTDDIQFGSFLRRFETAVYGVWRYPAEASRLGIEGITAVRITFRRDGSIGGVQILESSGSRILDEEVLRTLRAIGPIGKFPKGYDRDEFHLIAFFHYGIMRGAVRSLH